MPGHRRKREAKASDGTAPPVSHGEVISPGEPRAREDWQRPPFEPGNQLAVTHGAYSADLVNKTADEIFGPIFELIQTLQGYHEVDQLLVAEFRETTAQLFQLRKRTRELGGLLDAENKPRSYWLLERQLARSWLDQAKALGIGAAERAKVFGSLMSGAKAAAEAVAAQQRLRDRAKRPGRKASGK